MEGLFKQLKPCRCDTITHYAPPASLRVVDSVRHNHALYCITPREFLVSCETMAVPVVNRNLRIEDSFKMHNIHTKFNKKYV